MIITIASVLRNKGSTIHAVSPDATAYEAVAMMVTRRIAAVLAIEHGSVSGIFSAKDYGTRILVTGKDGKGVLVREVMTSPVVTADPELKVVDAMQIMTTKGIRHLPILEHGSLVGLVTLADLVRALLADQEFTIDQLMRYIGQR